MVSVGAAASAMTMHGRVPVIVSSVRPTGGVTVEQSKFSVLTSFVAFVVAVRLQLNFLPVR